MNSTKKTARIAGVLYLVNGVTGFFSIIYVPNKLFVSRNAAATAHNILASERLFRLGINWFKVARLDSAGKCARG